MRSEDPNCAVSTSGTAPRPPDPLSLALLHTGLPAGTLEVPVGATLQLPQDAVPRVGPSRTPKPPSRGPERVRVPSPVGSTTTPRRDPRSLEGRTPRGFHSSRHDPRLPHGSRSKKLTSGNTRPSARPKSLRVPNLHEGTPNPSVSPWTPSAGPWAPRHPMPQDARLPCPARGSSVRGPRGPGSGRFMETRLIRARLWSDKQLV